METVRFAKVVAESGQPEPYTLWTAPESDRDFQAALKQQRVMTVHQETVGSKKDYGEVGFTGDRQSMLLLFPKSLKAFEGKRVVGVRYDLLTPAPEVKKPSKPRVEKAAPKPPAKKSKQSFGELRIFRPEEPARPASKEVTKPAEEEPAERISKKATEPASKKPEKPTAREPVKPRMEAPAVVRAKPLEVPPKAPRDEDTEMTAALLDRLTREVRRAMKQLQSGKAVAAYQTLEKALAG